MIDMLKNAKDLIAKGKQLNDPELISMGMELLEQYSGNTTQADKQKDTKKTLESYYKCENCNNTIPFDRAGRKKCPKCKKHKLVVIEQKRDIVTKKTNIVDEFHMQIRDNKSRIHYDDEGKPDGTIRKVEPVDPSKFHNTWNDDGIEAQDKINEMLKKITKRSPRTRPRPKMVEVKCSYCNRVESVHPIHVGGRGRYVCSKCILRRGKS